MNHLMQMHIGHGIKQLAQQAPSHRLRQDGICRKRASVHPFHSDAIAQQRMLKKIVIFPDIGMLESSPDFIFLA